MYYLDHAMRCHTVTSTCALCRCLTVLRRRDLGRGDRDLNIIRNLTFVHHLPPHTLPWAPPSLARTLKIL